MSALIPTKKLAWHAEMPKPGLLDGEVRAANQDFGDQLLRILDDLPPRLVQPLLQLHVITPVEPLVLKLEHLVPLEPAGLSVGLRCNQPRSGRISGMNAELNKGAD